MNGPSFQRSGKTLGFILATSIFLAASSLTRAGVLFSDNFDSGASALWQNDSGAWTAIGGVYDATAPNNFPNAHSSLPFNLTNFFVDVDINGVSDGGIWLRSGPAAGAVGVKGVLLVLKYADFGGGVKVYWHIADGNSYGDSLNLVVGSFPAGSNPHVHVEVSGNTYSAFINGATNPITTLTTSAFASGQVGLYDFSPQPLITLCFRLRERMASRFHQKRFRSSSYGGNPALVRGTRSRPRPPRPRTSG